MNLSTESSQSSNVILFFSFLTFYKIHNDMHSISYPGIKLIFFPTLKQSHTPFLASPTSHQTPQKQTITTPYQVDNKLTNDPHSHHYACTCNTAQVSTLLEDKLLLILSPRPQSKWRKSPLTLTFQIAFQGKYTLESLLTPHNRTKQ